MADEEIGARLRLRDRPQFSADANRAAQDVQKVGRSADHVDRSARRASGGLGLLRGGLGLAGRAARAAATGLAIAGGAIGALAVKTVGLAMDAAETQSKFSTVFKGMEGDVAAFIKTTNTKFGIPTKELQDAASTFGVFAKAADLPSAKLASFSTSLTQAGLDLASFYNAEPGDVFLALRSGLAGEAEPLRKFGIFLSDATMKAKASQMGFKKELTESQKVMVRQAIILDSLGDANGDLERTSAGLANQWRGVKGRMQEAGVVIGQALIPYATQLANEINTRMVPAIEWLRVNLPPMIDKAATKMKGLRDTFTEAGGGIAGAKKVLDSMFGAGTGDTAASAGSALAEMGRILKDEVVPAARALTPSMDTIRGGLKWIADHPKAVAVITGLAGAMWLSSRATKSVTSSLVLMLPLRVAETAATILSARANQKLAFQLGVLTGMQRRNIISTIASKVAMGASAVATGAWTAAQWLLNAALTANPIGLIVVGIAALVAGLVWAYTHSQTFRDVVASAFTVVKNAALSVFNFFKNNWPLILAFITGPLGLATLFVIRNWDTIVGFFTEAPGKLAKAGAGMFDFIKKSFKSAVNFVIRGWNNLEFKIPGFDPPGPGPSFDGFTIGTPDIPQLWKGGTVSAGGMAWVGERGPELAFLPPAAQVLPAPESAALDEAIRDLGSGGGPLVVQLTLDRRVVSEAVIDDWRDKVARR